jgi:uncharacterized protein (UPF0335 family)
MCRALLIDLLVRHWGLHILLRAMRSHGGWFPRQRLVAGRLSMARATVGSERETVEVKKEVFSEAKGESFGVKILKEIIKPRKQDQDERDEHEALLDVYMRAMDEAGPAPVAEAA